MDRSLSALEPRSTSASHDRGRRGGADVEDDAENPTAFSAWAVAGAAPPPPRIGVDLATEGEEAPARWTKVAAAASERNTVH